MDQGATTRQGPAGPLARHAHEDDDERDHDDDDGPTQQRSMTMEHIILVAFDVDHLGSMKEAQEFLMERLKDVRGPFNGDVTAPDYDPDRPYVDSWWIAEDERYDGSDNDSAVFVPLGQQNYAQAVARVFHPHTEDREAILRLLGDSTYAVSEVAPGRELLALRALRDAVMIRLGLTEEDVYVD